MNAWECALIRTATHEHILYSHVHDNEVFRDVYWPQKKDNHTHLSCHLLDRTHNMNDSTMMTQSEHLIYRWLESPDTYFCWRDEETESTESSIQFNYVITVSYTRPRKRLIKKF